jgi:hypothetical protein
MVDAMHKSRDTFQCPNPKFLNLRAEGKFPGKLCFIKAAVLEGIRRTGELGATIAYVGSGQAFYEAMGFSKLFAGYYWIKYFEV